MSNEATEAVREVGDHPIVEGGARLGYAANGLLHILIAWIAVQVAVVGSAAKADQSGALASLTGSTMGTLTLWVAVAGYAGLSLWQLTEAILLRDNAARAKSAAKTVLYAGLAWSAWGFLAGAGSDSGSQTVRLTRTLMQQPLGRILVGALGLIVLGVAAYHVVKGWQRRFLRDLSEHPGRWAVVSGQWGYIAKGVALAFVAFLFLVAAFKGAPREATGLDGGLRTLTQLPGGIVPMLFIALGFAAYGVYSFARSRYAKV